MPTASCWPPPGTCQTWARSAMSGSSCTPWRSWQPHTRRARRADENGNTSGDLAVTLSQSPRQISEPEEVARFEKKTVVCTSQVAEFQSPRFGQETAVTGEKDGAWR